MIRLLKVAEEIVPAMGVTGSWAVFTWSVIEPLYTVLQPLALLASIVASIMAARYYATKAENERKKQD